MLKVEATADATSLATAQEELTEKFGDKSVDCFPMRRNSIFGIASTATIISLLSLHCDGNTYSRFVLKTTTWIQSHGELNLSKTSSRL